MKLRYLLLGLALLPGAVAAKSPSPQAIVITTAHDENAVTSEVRWVDAITGTSVRSVSLPHPKGAVVRGDLLGDAAFVVADDGDPEFGSTLYRADSAGLAQLATGLVHASRPLASSDGWIYVERGSRGTNRIDALTIDAIDHASGLARRVLFANAWALHLAGEYGNDLIVYRVDPSGAEIHLVDKRSGTVRVLASIPPFARDFSIDRDALGLSNRDEHDAHLWVVERIDLKTGTRARLHEERDESPAPFASPLSWTAPRRSGLFVNGKTTAPMGAGFDQVCASSGTMMLVRHVPASGFDETYVLDGASFVDLSHGRERIEPIGFAFSASVVR